MIFEKIVYISIILLFLSYFIYRYVKYTNKYALVNIGFEVIALTLLVLVYFNNHIISNYLQAIIFVFGYIIPLITLISVRYNINYIYEFKYMIANVLYLTNQKNQALELYKNIGTKYKKYKVYKKIATLCLQNNLIEEALYNIYKAQEIKSNKYKDHYKIAYIKVILDEYEEAQTILNNIIKDKPKYKPALNLLAYIYLKCNRDDDKALKIYFDIIKYDNKDSNTYYNIGAIYFKEKQYKKANNFLDLAIKYDSKMYSAYYLKGYVHFICNEYELAQKYLQIATQDKQLNADAYYMLARLYMKENEKGKATNCLNMAISNNEMLASKMQEEEIFKPISKLVESVDQINSANDNNLKNVTDYNYEYIKKFDVININEYIMFEENKIDNKKNENNKRSNRKKSK